MRTLRSQDRAKKFYDFLADNYALHGQESDKFYGTDSSNIKRTLVSLHDLGMVVLWVDIEDPERWFASAIS